MIELLLITITGIIAWIVATLIARRPITRLETEIHTQKERATRAEATLEAANRFNEEQKSHHQSSIEELRNAFKALSSDTLKELTPEFIRQADETFKRFKAAAEGDFKTKQESINSLLEPLKQSLHEYQTRLQQSESQQNEKAGVLSEQLRQLVTQTTKLETEARALTTALRKPQGSGRWGELTLERVVEISGMSKYCDFDTQVSVNTEDGRLRPDMIINLPRGGTVVVDSKAPLNAFLDAVDALDETSRTAHLTRHAVAVRSHVSDLSKKAYWNQFENAPEFAILFLPGESFFSAALEQDRTLMEDALTSRIVLATPATLIAVLRSVALTWQQHEQAANAREIARAGGELFDRIRIFTEHLSKVGAALDNATRSYNTAVGSLESRVLISARRMKELGVQTAEEELDVPKLVETTLRPLSGNGE